MQLTAETPRTAPRTEFAAAPDDSRDPFLILLVDDHVLIRRGLGMLLEAEENYRICGEATNAEEARGQVRTLRPDVVITDLSLAGANGIDLVRELRAGDASLLVVVLSMHEDSLHALRALRAGANAYVTKRDAATGVLEALEAVTAGQSYVSSRFRTGLSFQSWQLDAERQSPPKKLSPREREVLQLMGLGLSTREIGETLELSIKTVETHRGHIKTKLRFKTNAEMLRFAVECVVGTE